MDTRIEIPIREDLCYFDSQGDFWYRVPQTGKHLFVCVFLHDGYSYILQHTLGYKNETTAIDNITDSCYFRYIGMIDEDM